MVIVVISDIVTVLYSTTLTLKVKSHNVRLLTWEIHYHDMKIGNGRT